MDEFRSCRAPGPAGSSPRWSAKARFSSPNRWVMLGDIVSPPARRCRGEEAEAAAAVMRLLSRAKWIEHNTYSLIAAPGRAADAGGPVGAAGKRGCCGPAFPPAPPCPAATQGKVASEDAMRVLVANEPHPPLLGSLCLGARRRMGRYATPRTRRLGQFPGRDATPSGWSS